MAKTPEQVDEAYKLKLKLLRDTGKELARARAELSAIRIKAPRHEVVQSALHTGRSTALKGAHR